MEKCVRKEDVLVVGVVGAACERVHAEDDDGHEKALCSDSVAQPRQNVHAPMA